MSGLKEPEPSTGGIRLDEGALGGGGLRADTPLTSGSAAAASAPMAFGFSAAELQDAEVMMRRKLWRDTAAKLGFAERRVELMAETIDPVAVHTAIREFVSRKKVLEGKGANFAHLKQLRAYPEFNKWYEQLATFERMEPGAARAALAGYMQAEIRQWLATRAREFYDNDGQIDAGEWALLVRDAELFWLVEGVAAKEAQTACRVATGDSLWVPPPPDESAELRAREVRQELEARETVLREEAQRQAQASAALEEQTLALQAMERKAAEMMAQAASATEGAERKAAEVLAQAGRGTEAASSPCIPAAPAATSSKREKGSSTAWRNGLVIAGVAVVGVLGVVYSNGVTDPSVDAKAVADADPKCKPGSGMKPIPAGTFTMGDAESTDKAGQVTVAAFCMDTTEVTTTAYVTCVKTGKCRAATTSGSCNVGVAEPGNHPINCVNWNQATAYCAAQGQRLPTEEEWEYAARGTDGRVYPWGNAEPAGQLCWNGEGNSLGKGNRNSTCAVASFPAGNSPFGLSDMSGNVWEWTSSAFSATNAGRVNRGGSWFNDDPSLVRSAYRTGRLPSNQYVAALGFRCAGSLFP